MARTKKDLAEVGTEAEAVVETQPQPRDAMGRLLDQWGLPVNGRARAEILAEMRKADPNEDPEGWEGATVPQLREVPDDEAGGKTLTQSEGEDHG